MVWVLACHAGLLSGSNIAINPTAASFLLFDNLLTSDLAVRAALAQSDRLCFATIGSNLWAIAKASVRESITPLVVTPSVSSALLRSLSAIAHSENLRALLPQWEYFLMLQFWQAKGRSLASYPKTHHSQKL